MRYHRSLLWGSVFCLFVAATGWGQLMDSPTDLLQKTNVPSSLEVPWLIKFSGVLKDLNGKPFTWPVEATFAIYKGEADTAPLWQETSTVEVDDQGRFVVLLGAQHPEGLPKALFASAEARWLGISAGKLPEQPRVLLVAVPYALNAADAETLGGRPASAYMLDPKPPTWSIAATSSLGVKRVPRLSGGVNSRDSAVGGPGSLLAPIATNYIPVFLDGSGTLGSSVMYQNGANIGIGTTTAGTLLDLYANPYDAVADFLTVDAWGNKGANRGAAIAWNLPDTGNATAGARISAAREGTNLNSYLAFSTNNGSAVTEKVRINSSGRVGIGTTAPGTLLDVYGSPYDAIADFVTLNATGNKGANRGGRSCGTCRTRQMPHLEPESAQHEKVQTLTRIWPSQQTTVR